MRLFSLFRSTDSIGWPSARFYAKQTWGCYTRIKAALAREERIRKRCVNKVKPKIKRGITLALAFYKA
jgi:hypothetical protein